MKAQIRKELVEIILVGIVIIVVAIAIGGPLYASTNLSTGNSFKQLAYYVQDFINNNDVYKTPEGTLVSYPMPYFVNQNYFLMICEQSTLCICGKDKCKESKPYSKQKFEGYELEILGNHKLENGAYTITGDPGLWTVRGRGTKNVYLRKTGKDDKKIYIIDCSVKERSKDNACTGKVQIEPIEETTP